MNLYLLFVINFLFGLTTTVGMTLIPLIAVDTLALSYFMIGIIEACSEVSANVFKYVFGVRFDKNKKHIFIFPAILGLLAKVILFMPSSITLLASKYLERLSNGAFASSRDASVGFFTKRTGISDAVMTMCKSAGCIIAPLMLGAFAYFNGSLKDNINEIIVIASLLSLVALILCSKININAYKYKKSEIKKDVSAKQLISIATIFFACRFNDGLIMLFLKKSGYAEWFYVSTIGIFNIFVFCASFFFGYLNDLRLQKLVLLIVLYSMTAFGISFAALTFLQSYVIAMIGLAAWGVQRGGASLVFLNILQNYYSQRSIGYNIGILSLCTGISIFISSLIAGFIATYSFFTVFISVAAISLLLSLYCIKYFKL